MVQRYSIHHGSLYPVMPCARGNYLFTSHFGTPLAVWDKRWVSKARNPTMHCNAATSDPQAASYGNTSLALQENGFVTVSGCSSSSVACVRRNMGCARPACFTTSTKQHSFSSQNDSQDTGDACDKCVKSSTVSSKLQLDTGC